MLKRLLILIAISIMFSSCTKDTRDVINFSTWGSVTEIGILHKIIDDFENQNPEIKINLIHVPQNYFQKLHLLFASNTAPDIMFINNLYLPIYAEHLEDLGDVVNSSEFFSQGINAMTINGKCLAVPRDISNFIFFYNKDVLGFSPKENMTIEEFYSLVKKYNSAEHFGVSYEQDVFKAEPYLLTMGFENGMSFYKNLEGKYAPTPADVGSSTLAQMFLDGKIVFYLSGRWMYPKINETAEFRYGTMAFPGKVYSDASGWAISKSSKKKENAKKFVKYISSKEQIDFFTETGLIIPARKDSAKKLIKEEDKAFIQAILKSETRIPDKNYRKHTDLLNKQYFN